MSLSPASAPGDRLPIWLFGLLILFLVLRVSDLASLSPQSTTGPSKNGPSKMGRLSQSLAGQVDDKTMSSLMTTNWAAKSAFFASLEQSGKIGPDRKALREALKSAESLQKDTQNSPAAARRILILRALLHQPMTAGGMKELDPMQAFQPSALKGLSPEDRNRSAAEGRLWADVVGGKHLTPGQTEGYAALLRAIPNIRWWLYPALATLYQSQGDKAAMDRSLQQAQSQALLTLVPLSLMLLLWAVLGLGGVVLLIYQVVRLRHNKTLSPGSTPLPNPWPTLPETVPVAERRLRAGDLMGVFLLYLLMPYLLGWLLAGFGIPHVFHFSGLLGDYKNQVTTLPASQQASVVVILEFFAYLFSAAVPIVVLLSLARRRGASVGAELGWNGKRIGINLLYGVGGYGIALPLVMVAGLAGQHIPGPTPSNPAIPLLANASSPWVQALLVLLATVAAPLTEELLFRGVFYNAAKLQAGVWPAIVLTGLIFGFVHPVGIGEMLPLAILGGVFAWLAETRKSLVPSILGHCLQNTMATLMLLLILGG